MGLYVVAYDIVDSRTRERVARVLEQYGERAQQSVFEVWLAPGDVRELKVRIGPLLGEEDRFAIYPLDERPGRRRLYWRSPGVDWSPVVMA